MRTISNPELFRSNIRSEISKILETEKDANNLEIGIFNYALRESTTRKVVKKWDNPFFVQIYTDRLKSILINLQNPQLLGKVNSGEIESKTLAFMTHQEMMPEKWDAIIQLQAKRNKSKFEDSIMAATDTFTCRKCKSKKCTYYQQQVRSADEPMTTFVSCIDCGNRWKC
jgi:transcription elongation factor S-II